MNFDQRIQRDSTNAARVPPAAREALKQRKRFAPQMDMVRGVNRTQLKIAHQLDDDMKALLAIAHHPFDAMVEVELRSPRGTLDRLWYAHLRINRNQVVPVDGEEVNVLAWSHPGFQLAMTGSLNDWQDLDRSALAITAVKARARAKYSALVPSVVGLYDPGGQVGDQIAAKAAQAGLKAVKLEMTPEQVAAFIARMNGLLIITGAPGTGKTTIAFQRIRFLLDQQALRVEGDEGIEYSPTLTRVFLGSRNLIEYSKDLLKRELDIPPYVVSFVPDVISEYVERVWQSRENARPITRHMDSEVQASRQAMFNLCSVKDLKGVWVVLERQALTRLRQSDEGKWIEVAEEQGRQAGVSARALARALTSGPTRSTGEPLGSWARMDSLWATVRMSYIDCRNALPERVRDRFDRAFASWLFWVFDPIDVLYHYFSAHQKEAANRILSGTLGRLDPTRVVREMLDDWEKRLFGTTELSWIAWLLRFVLPEDAGQEDGFRGVPRALPQPEHKTIRRWTHVVIDEAQDLSVQEASLLASFVHPKGALTISADFHQVVSPVHGMTNGEALKFGLPIWDQKLHLQFPFQRNLRQSREIAQFLKVYYQGAFGEFPPFEAGPRQEGIKPQLFVGSEKQFPQLIAQMVNVLRKGGDIGRIAVLSIHDTPSELQKLRTELKNRKLPLAEPEQILDAEHLVITTVEKAKGLEFDACIVVGLDDLEHASMNFAKNRAYVALSRPTRRLFMLCQRDPVLLHKVPKDLFDKRQL